MNRGELLRKIYWVSAFLSFFVLVFVISVFFLNPSSVGNARFVWNINLWAVVWAVNFIVVSVLLFILARDLIKLFFEYHAHRPGSRIKSKLVMTLIIFSLFPALSMLFLAFGLINRNLSRWFSSPSEQLLDSSRVIAARYYDQRETLSTVAARFLAAQVLASDLGVPSDFDQLARKYGFNGLVFFNSRQQVIFRVGDWAADRRPEEALPQVLRGEDFYQLVRNRRPVIVFRGSTNIDHGLVGVPVRDAKSVRGALFARFVVPESVAFHALQVEDAAIKYEAIKGGANQLETNYFAILALTTLAMVFGFVWLGSYIARRITVPLEALAEGSRELAGGNLDYRVSVKAVDELGILVQSFNRMAEQIRESRSKLEQANAELRETNVRLEDRRAYIETVLQNIATGVVSIDESDIIRTVNEAALKMLRMSRDQILNQPLQKVADAELYEDFQRLRKRARVYGTHRSEMTFHRGERALHIAATITANPLPVGAGAEYLIVLDDLTELIKAEKFAAWQEVARRLAHEIKNPLTPIQLSAERIRKRFEKIADSLPPIPDMQEFRNVLEEAIRVIVAESEMLKSLVLEFSRFARLPICRPVETDLHGLIERSLGLYDGILGGIQVKKRFDPQIEHVKVDPEQMQRVFVNLIDNSLDALADCEGERCIWIGTRFNADRGSITIEFQDNGAGIRPDDYEHLFLPYFSTKKKGTGLGLAIVRQIVSEHNGYVRAEPSVPQGTRFVMELPVG